MSCTQALWATIGESRYYIHDVGCHLNVEVVGGTSSTGPGRSDPAITVGLKLACPARRMHTSGPIRK